MMHVMYGDKSLLMGDQIARALLKYAAALGAGGGADTVAVNAIGADGNEVEAIFLLNAGSALVAESAHTTLPEPDNANAIAQVRTGLASIQHRPVTSATDGDDVPDFDLDDYDYDEGSRRS